MQLTMLTLPDQFTQHPSVLRYLSGASWHFDSSTTDASLSNVKNHIVCGDAIEVLSSLPSECVDLIHTSPPYNIDRPYEMSTSDKSPGLEYFNFLRDSVRQLKRVLRPGGSIFWQTGYTQESNGSRGIIPIDLYSYEIFREEPTSLLLWDRIIWRYWGGHAFTRKFTNKHETILWFVKPGGEPIFDVDSVREKAKEYDKRNNFWGRNPGNVWEVDRVAFGSTEQTSHIAVFPEEVSERIIRACSKPESFVLDPFAGSGTVPKIAQGLGRRWLGIEISPVYAAEAAIRVGYQQPGETDSLASELAKHFGFNSKRGTLLLNEIQRRICTWLTSVPLEQLRMTFEADIQSVFDISNGRNQIKRDIWGKYDGIFSSQHRIESPIQLVDRLLMRCYKLRRHFNGVRRYNSALVAVEELAKNMVAGRAQAYLRRIICQEPSSFMVAGDTIEFLSTRRNVFAIPGESVPIAQELTEDTSDQPIQKQMTL